MVAKEGGIVDLTMGFSMDLQSCTRVQQVDSEVLSPPYPALLLVSCQSE